MGGLQCGEGPLLFPIYFNCHCNWVLHEFSYVLIFIIAGPPRRLEAALSLVHDAARRKSIRLLYLLAVVFLVDEDSFSRGPVIICPHLRHQILKQLVLFRRGECIGLLVPQVRVLSEIDASSAELLVAVAAVVFDNVGIPSRAIWRIVHILEWFNQFRVHRGLIFYPLDIVVERIAAANALAEGLWLQATITQYHVRVTAGTIATVCCELLMVGSVTWQHCRSVHFLFGLELLKERRNKIKYN